VKSKEKKVRRQEGPLLTSAHTAGISSFPARNRSLQENDCYKNHRKGHNDKPFDPVE